MLRKGIFFFFFALSCLSLPAGAKRLTKGFKIAKMQLEIPYRSDLDVPSKLSENDAWQILSQHFRYLDKGAQCYAFLSEDDQYVLKLFRFDQRHFFKKKKRPKMEKISQFLEGCKLAYIFAPEETGLIYLHLNQTSGLYPVLKARGPLGQPLRLPLDRYRFALQKKAVPLETGLFEALSSGKLIERVDEIILLLKQRISKGIGNTDPSLWRNFGFLENRAIEIDFGNYTLRPDFSEERFARAEFERYVRSLRTWVEKYAPEYCHEFKERVEEAQF